MSTVAAARSAVRLPRQIPYIIGNEACERFSFYGMRNILTPFLVSTLLLDAPAADRAGLAKDVFHSFVIGVYFFPLLGGWLSDRFFGKYNTVLWFSLIYCAGHALLAAFDDDRRGFYAGLFLIALGSGGIKPLVVSFVGDQFDQSSKGLAKVVFDAFYWSINFGSFFASLLMPIFLREYGPAVAFGIPGILMGIATLIFWLGRTQYVRVPPTRGQDPHSFFHVAATALSARAEGRGRPGLVLAACGATLAAVLLVCWALKPAFWPAQFEFVITFCLALGALIVFGGVGTALQLERARGAPSGPGDRRRAVGAAGPHRLRARDAVLVALRPEGVDLGPSGQRDARAARRVVVAQLAGSRSRRRCRPSTRCSSCCSFPSTTCSCSRCCGGPGTSRRRCAAWAGASRCRGSPGSAPVPFSCTSTAAHRRRWRGRSSPTLLLTTGEVLVSATALEFAYSQATTAMKGVIMAFWYLSVTFGNLWVLLTNAAVRNDAVTARIAGTGFSEPAFLMFFFAVFAFAAALAFALYARRYPLQDHYRTA